MTGIVSELFEGGVDNIVKDTGEAINKKAELKEALAVEQVQANAQIDIATLKDKDSARQREVGVKDKTPAILAFFITSGFFGILAFMLKYDIPATNKTELDLILGSLGTAWIAVVSYYFGSSVGSRAKDDTIGNLSR